MRPSRSNDRVPKTHQRPSGEARGAGQRAILAALAYPKPQQGRRTDLVGTSQEICEVKQQTLSHLGNNAGCFGQRRIWQSLIFVASNKNLPGHV
jgi:hypothetical protein